MAETFAPLMASVEAKNELERQGLKVSLKSYFLSLILKDLENPDILLIDNYINALFNSANEACQRPYNGSNRCECSKQLPPGRN